MEFLVLLFKTLRKSLLAIFLVCIAFVILDEFWIEDLKKSYPHLVRAANVFDRLCMSYISAFIFYFVVVHYKAQKDKLIIYNSIVNKVDSIIGDCQETFRELANKASINLQGDYPTDEEISTVCLKVYPSSSANIVDKDGTFGSWLDYLSYRTTRSEDALEKIFKKMSFLDADLVKVLADIEDCSYFINVKFYKTQTVFISKNFKFLETQFIQYRNLIQALDSYSQEKLEKYRT